MFKNSKKESENDSNQNENDLNYLKVFEQVDKQHNKMINKIKWKIIDFKDYIIAKYIKRTHLIDTKIPPTRWCDKDILMLYANMSLLEDFVEKEKCFEVVNYDFNNDYKVIGNEIKEIYNWWKEHKNYYYDGNDWIGELSCAFDDNENDIKLIEEEQQMLIRLIKIRKYLWT